MSDLPINASTTFANTLNAISSSTSGANSASSSSSADLMSDFSTIMMIMLLGSMSSQSSSDIGSDSSFSMGMNMNQLMAPLMLTLLEKLASSKIETATAADIAPTHKTGENGRTGDPRIPAGMPAKGPLTQGSHPGHVALDIGVSVGTKIKSTMSGEVVFAGWSNIGYGNLVIVKNGKFSTYYAHLSNIPVNIGDQVDAGDVIGISGNTGNSTGPHLHYEIRVNRRAVDPSKYTLI